ncbi:hypothetical protein KIMH_10230 [Bombiscardovia apis]|uniref:Uncharacterized protein n=1 Tax=Bombiscardovia apis TaxID=2932182 RepID=A0ABM8BDC3_9BIFI|nr:hypothetical protein [Bombiscardovia apis]BDR54912.1 hypothetical protein KIMH_10230 [Bombiscardovia apis]
MKEHDFDITPILAAIQGQDFEPSSRSTQAAGRSQSASQGEVLLTEAERREAISGIVRKGLPRRRGLMGTVLEMSHTLGFKNLLFGVWDCAFLGLLLGLLIWSALLGLLQQSAGRGSSWYMPALSVLVFTLSPLSYQAMQLLVVWKERSFNTAYLLQTCRWSLRQISSVRMLCFGLLSTVASALTSAALEVMTGGALPWLKVMGISFASLFLYALVQLGIDSMASADLAMVLPSLLWLAAGLGLWLGRTRVVSWLLALPTAVSLAAGLLTAVLFLFALACKCLLEPGVGVWLRSSLGKRKAQPWGVAL